MRLQMLQVQLQQQQLAMLQLMQEAGAFPAASLLSHGSAQGSSNLIYILKSLQVRAPPRKCQQPSRLHTML